MNKSLLIALVAVVALILWMLSGQLGETTEAKTTAGESAVATPAGAENAGETRSSNIIAMKVQTRRQSAKEITREVIIQGQVEPIKVITIKSEATGSIESISVVKGQRVEKDAVIVTMGADNRNASLTVARSSLVQARNEHAAASKLAQQGLQSKYNLEISAAKLESARAQVSAAELELDNTVIRAPLNGIVDELPVDTGDFVDRGNHIATLIDNSQLLITGQIPQQNIADVKLGTVATAELITGGTLTGTVQYVSSMADAATRSFRVEILVPSPPARAMTGISAEIRIPTETMRAHLISPAILALDENGTLGVKSVDNNSEVIFHPIEVVKTESTGAWVTGIPEDIDVITLGQGFVNAGEKVQAVPEKPETETPVSAESVSDEPVSGKSGTDPDAPLTSEPDIAKAPEQDS